jgi:hypothetical protein
MASVKSAKKPAKPKAAAGKAKPAAGKTLAAKSKKPASPALVPLRTPLPRTAKGKRPQYFHDPATDRLQSMVVALMAELSVTRDRLDTLERLLEKAGGPTRKMVESFDPTPAVEAERSASRNAYIGRVMRPISRELDAMKMAAKS